MAIGLNIKLTKTNSSAITRVLVVLWMQQYSFAYLTNDYLRIQIQYDII